MNTKTRMYQLVAILSSLAVLALITLVGKNVAGLNATTVAFLYLLVVLVASTFADLACGIAVAVTSGLLVDFYFLPPFGTFYIAAPEDWVSLVVYTATATVIGYFAATVRQRAVEADRLQAELSRLARFTKSFQYVRREGVTLDFMVSELRNAYELSYCAIYFHDKTVTPVVSGIRPSQIGRTLPSQPGTFLEVISEEGTDVRCLTLTDQGKTIGILVISQVSLSPEAMDAITALVSLVVRQCPPFG